MAEKKLFWVIARNPQDSEDCIIKSPLVHRSFYHKGAADDYADWWNGMSTWHHTVMTTSQCLDAGIQL